MAVTPLGWCGVLGILRKQAKQAMGIKPVSTISSSLQVPVLTSFSEEQHGSPLTLSLTSYSGHGVSPQQQEPLRKTTWSSLIDQANLNPREAPTSASQGERLKERANSTLVFETSALIEALAH